MVHDRRKFLTGLGGIALAHLMARDGFAEPLPGLPHFPPKAKRVIYLFQEGGVSQLDTFDYKPKLETLRGQDLPDSVRNGQRFTAMTAGQSSFPLAPSYLSSRSMASRARGSAN